MRRASHFIPILLSAAWALGCASTPSPEEAALDAPDEAAIDAEAQAPSDIEAEVVESEPEPPIDPAWIAGPPLEVVVVGALPSESPPLIAASGEELGSSRPSFWRADGRPAWWLAEPRREDGRVTVTAEAIGEDLGDARAKAIVAGRAALERCAGPAPGGEKIESLIVRRLDGDAPGRARYVGYARLSAREPEKINP